MNKQVAHRKSNSPNISPFIKSLLTSCFGLGYIPLASGTWGSLPPVIIFVRMSYCNQDSKTISMTMLVLAIVGSIICIRFAPVAIRARGVKDPSEVVIDEFSGQSLTFIIIGLIKTPYFFTVAIFGFLLFRFFDIFKPTLIRRLENLPRGWGILADDLAAGAYSAVILQFFYYIGLVGFIDSRFSKFFVTSMR